MELYKDIRPFNKRPPKFKHPDGTITKGEILDEVEIECEERENKLYKYLVQKIKWFDREELRFCYYYNDLSDVERGWIFGQFALTLSVVEYVKLIEKMKQKGWI